MSKDSGSYDKSGYAVVTPTGKYTPKMELVTVATPFTCSSTNKKAQIYRPTDTGTKYPLISYAHGFGLSSEKYESTDLMNLASHGYIIIAHLSPDATQYC
jgi:predicted dienelactone hydrolase